MARATPVELLPIRDTECGWLVGHGATPALVLVVHDLRPILLAARLGHATCRACLLSTPPTNQPHSCCKKQLHCHCTALASHSAVGSTVLTPLASLVLKLPRSLPRTVCCWYAFAYRLQTMRLFLGIVNTLTKINISLTMGR